MTVNKQTITVHLSQEMSVALEKLGREHGESTDTLIQRAIAHYIEARSIEELFDYGSWTSEKQKLAPEDVEHLIDEYRSETG